MQRQTTLAVAGVALAIAITTTMDATGYTMFSALPLFPLAAVFWYLSKTSRREVGLVWGRMSDYAIALAYPLTVLGLAWAIAAVSGATATGDSDWMKALANVGLMSTTGVIMVLITEEGFFRGWLWAALARTGQSETRALIFTSLAFTLWHVSAISLDTGFDVPAAQIPIFLVNATLIGGIFGMLRMYSGSVVVASVGHAVWNGIDYPLFGFGEKAGALGIAATDIFGPEVGIVGLGLNLVFAAVLWRLMMRRAPLR